MPRFFQCVGFKVREELSLRLKSANNPKHNSRVSNEPYAQAHGYAERAARTAAQGKIITSAEYASGPVDLV